MFRKHSPQSGFTLIELMVALVIVGVLVAIAVPSYYDKVLKSHRVEAKTALVDLAGREERFFNTNNTYSQTPSDLGYGATAATFPMTIGSGYYTVSVAFTPYSAGPPVVLPAYTITATAIGNQLKDTNCTSFTLTSTGVQTSLPNTSNCW